MAKVYALYVPCLRRSACSMLSLAMAAMIWSGVAPKVQAQDTAGQAHRIAASAIEGITIDGDLKDWPATLPRYPVRKMLYGPPFHGYNGLKNADLSTSPDLSIAFSVGFSPREQLLYLAVVVRDDKLIVGHDSYLASDAIEVFVDGQNSRKDIPFPVQEPWWEHYDIAKMTVQQYVGIPGEGRIYGSKYDTNPIFLGGDLARTKTRMAYRREGDITTYEWAIQPFDKYPDEPTKLEPGKTLGFDLTIVDRDVERKVPESVDDLAAWVYWGPSWRGAKAFMASSLGEVVLAKDGAEPIANRPLAPRLQPERVTESVKTTSEPAAGAPNAEGELREMAHELEELTTIQRALWQRTARMTIRIRQALEASNKKD